MDPEEEEVEEREQEWGGAIATLVMVSCSRWDAAGVALAALRAVAGKCIKEAHLLGVALFSTLLDQDKGLANVAQLMPIKDITLEDLQTLAGMAEDVPALERQWGTGEANLGDALWLAARMFSACKKKTVEQNLILVGHLPEPPADAAARRTALKKAADLLAMNVNLTMICVGDGLREDSFYAELAEASSSPPFEWSPPPVVSSIDDVASLLWRSSRRRRAFCNLNMELGDGVEIGVGLFYLCRVKSAPRAVKLNRETDDRVVRRRQMGRSAEEESAAPLLLSELRFHHKIGGRQVSISVAERAAMRKFSGPPSLRLLGFKSRSSLDMTEVYCRASAFLFPDERRATGSERLFLCLRDRCLRLEKIAVCVLVARWHSFPRLVALVPQERVETGGGPIRPDGFHVVFLPFADDRKKPPAPIEAPASDDDVARARRIVEALSLENYSEDLFENPKLERLYATVEALALGSAEVREVPDSTLPDLDAQDEKLGSLPEEFEEAFGPFGVKTTKRKRETAAAAGSTRKRKN